MNLFNFWKKESVFAPVDGGIVPFPQANKKVENGLVGFTIEPTANHIYSPVTGLVVALYPKQYAIDLKVGNLKIRLFIENGTKKMIDTPLSFYVSEGDTVAPETPLAFIDFSKVRESEQDVGLTLLIENTKDKVRSFKIIKKGNVVHDEEVMKLSINR